MKISKNRKAFTLLEVTVAAVISAFIALVAIGSFQTVLAGRETVDHSIDASDKIRNAVNIIRTDLENLYRDTKAENVRFETTFEDTEEGEIMTLVMNVVSHVKARPSQIEGDLYRVQYFVRKDDEKQTLMRRYCPIVGSENDLLTQGGILTAIAEDVAIFTVLFFDGNQWVTQWPRSEKSLPGLVEVHLMTYVGEHEDEIEEQTNPQLLARSFTVGFPRMTAATGVYSGRQESEDEESSNQSDEDNEN